MIKETHKRYPGASTRVAMDGLPHKGCQDASNRSNQINTMTSLYHLLLTCQRLPLTQHNQKPEGTEAY